MMADLLIRKMPPGLKRRIREEAKKSGHSLSEEAKLLIESGLASRGHPKQLGTWLFNLVPPEYRGDDLVFERHDPARPPPELE